MKCSKKQRNFNEQLAFLKYQTQVCTIKQKTCRDYYINKTSMKSTLYIYLTMNFFEKIHEEAGRQSSIIQNCPSK